MVILTKESKNKQHAKWIFTKRNTSNELCKHTRNINYEYPFVVTAACNYNFPIIFTHLLILNIPRMSITLLATFQTKVEISPTLFLRFNCRNLLQVLSSFVLLHVQHLPGNVGGTITSTIFIDLYPT